MQCIVCTSPSECTRDALAMRMLHCHQCASQSHLYRACSDYALCAACLKDKETVVVCMHALLACMSTWEGQWNWNWNGIDLHIS